MVSSRWSIWERPKLHACARRELRHALQSPWCWPVETDRQALHRALEVVPEQPTALTVGEVPLLTISERCAGLWRFSPWSIQDNQNALEAGTPFAQRATQSWNNAACALARAIPVMWGSLQACLKVPLSAHSVVQMPLAGNAALPESVLDGDSFGLSFVLALASQLLQTPVPKNVAATAATTAQGSLAPIGGLEPKITLLLQRAPQIKQLLVAAEQRSQAQRFAGEDLDVVGVRNAGEALKAVFGENLADLLVSRGQDADSQQQLADSFFRLVTRGRSEAVDWNPVRRGASSALQSWDREHQLTVDTREKLRFAEAVASRHEGFRASRWQPDPVWLFEQPAPLRLQLAGNLVQQSADTGFPPPSEVLELADSFDVERTTDAFVEHVRLWGAVARLHAATGQAARALAGQKRASQALFARLREEELSYPLAEWFRLSGVLNDRESFVEAEHMLHSVMLQSDGSIGKNPYIRLARSKGLVSLSEHEIRRSTAQVSTPEELEQRQQELTDLAKDYSVPSHVRYSACRWAWRCAQISGDSALSDQIFERLERAAKAVPAQPQAQAFLYLLQMDGAVAANLFDDAEVALTKLKQQGSGVVARLVEACPEQVRTAAFVALHYLY